MKIASVVGVRPQFVKASVVSRELRKKHEGILIHTGQHYDYQMNKVFFEQLSIPEPDYHHNIGSRPYGFRTGEMLKQKLRSIVDAFSETNENIVFLLHSRTEKFLKKCGLYEKSYFSVILTQPLSFCEFTHLVRHAKIIFTNYRSVQKKAYLFKVPCVTLKEDTERVETIKGGWNVFVRTEKEKTVKIVKKLIPRLYTHKNIFENRNASKSTISIISHFNKNEVSL